VVQLGEDPLAELVARARERKCGVRVEALQAAAARRPADPAGELGSQLALFLVRTVEALLKRGVLLDGARPAFDPTACFQPRDRRHELRTGQVVRRRKRRPGSVTRPLLRHGRPTVGAADGYAPEGTWRATELSRNDGLILHAA
jgi:hypothetical protein